MNRLLAIVGPTATGKSALGVAAALELDGEIINCDSMQMVRYLDIGTAKPTSATTKKVPHHLYDIIDPDEYFSAGQYMHRARAVCNEITRRGRIPVLVGGTGLYLRAFFEGLFEGPSRSEPLRRRLIKLAESEGVERLHAILRRKDPEAARRVAPSDRIRLVRALEVFFETGEPISELQSKKKPLEGYQVTRVALHLPRQELYGRINRRVEEMFAGGLIQEVEDLLARGFSPDCKGFEALGYRHAVQVVLDRMSLQEGIERTRRDTRRYARRQMTWFRKEKDLHWIKCSGEQEGALYQTLELLSEERSY